MSITDPDRGRRPASTARTIQGDARVIEDDPHGGWERLLPDLGGEGAVDRLLPQGARRAAALLRAGAHRDHAAPGPLLVRRRRRDRAGRHRRRRGGRVMRQHRPRRSTPGPGLEQARRPIRTRSRPGFDDADGYPVSVAVDGRDRPGRPARATFAAPAGLDRPDRSRRSPDRLAHPPAAGLRLRRAAPRHGLGPRRPRRRRSRRRRRADRAWGWDEAEVPFFEYSERSVGQSRRYFDALSAERGTPVKPRLSFGFLALRTTRLPFLTATIVPVVARHPDRRAATARSTCVAARADDHRGVVRPARAERRERRLRHRPGRRRRERHADPVQRRLAGHPVRARRRCARWRRSRRVFYVAGRRSSG